MLCPIAAVLCGRGAQSHQWFQWPLPFSAFGPARDCERSGAERDWDDDCCDDKAAEREAQCRRAHTVSALIPLRLRGVAPVRSPACRRFRSHRPPLGDKAKATKASSRLVAGLHLSAARKGQRYRLVKTCAWCGPLVVTKN
jgi:hypothetical protein